MPDSLSFDTLLIANRGEISVRIIRTCREKGIRTVAVYSEADKYALHVQMADQSIQVGPSASSESYLCGDTIITAALECGAQAIHPGYGFLSENADFAQACADAGLIFVGPSPEAIRLMGDKTSARHLMQDAGVPMAPGTHDAISDSAEAKRKASSIGYPVLVKAAAGGGGKGMRVVSDPNDFESAFEMARGEALNAFGDGRVYLEKYLIGPRHIEIQVLADSHGNVVHLFERDCSIQRRHQKVVEEAPSTVLTPELRSEMGEAAIAAARACSYVGVGTVEFLLDSDLNYYFLEMNTRLQVEHPVTEMITGVDLVAEQLRIAQGETLGFQQEDVTIHGHSIECRIYAEDVQSDFLPDPGPIHRHRIPAGPSVRVDSGVQEGGEVPLYYDPMISKLITWGPSRSVAVERMRRALGEYEIVGVSTTIPFCVFVCNSEPFKSGNFTTSFVDDHFEPKELQISPKQERLSSMALTLSEMNKESTSHLKLGEGPNAQSQWSGRSKAY